MLNLLYLRKCGVLTSDLAIHNSTLPRLKYLNKKLPLSNYKTTILLIATAYNCESFELRQFAFTFTFKRWLCIYECKITLSFG